MLKIVLAVALAVMSVAAPAFAQDRTVEVIKTEEWLKLPQDWQVT